jgi:UDP-N-acetylglucosamine--N-acetylmuramyl-(pentapeptide) pyrophosphoryl-undecaprenol N-acetylglucosamine transferase
MCSDSVLTRARTILIAGGGSGGHIAPGLAIAERLPEVGSSIGARSEVRAVFVCSQRAVDEHMLRTANANFVSIEARPLGARPRAAIAFVRGYRSGRASCRRLIREHRVGHLLALGGFVSAPAVAAARSLAVPVTLLNLDDPPGKANRLIARRCDRVLSAVSLSQRPRFAERVVGLPIRRIALAAGSPAACRERLGLEPGRETLLVTGASQGATSINRLILALLEQSPEAFADWQVLHLAGAGSDAEPREAYARLGIHARVVEFCDHMGDAWGAASLAVSRAGANSVAEAAANAVPTLFLPYPYHRDMHQLRNAQPWAKLGGAVISTDHVDTAKNVQQAGRRLLELMAERGERDAMRSAQMRNRPPDAATEIAELLLERVLDRTG